MRLIRFAIPACLVAALAVLVVSLVAAQQREPHWFMQDLAKTDITEKAAAVVIEPRFRGVADDQFPYEIYINNSRHGTSTEGGKHFDSFRRTENWIVFANLMLREDDLEGRKDLQMAVQFGGPVTNNTSGAGGLHFLINNGLGRYSGYIGPANGANTAKFQEIHPDGSRTDVSAIPGWAGLSAGTLESNRSTQAVTTAGSAWFSIGEDGRPYNEQYFADWTQIDQRNYPGQLIDPVHLLLGLHAHFAKDTKLKIGESVKLTRRFPLGVVPGAAADYEFTYKLEKLYGTVEEPAAARFTFSATPRVARHSIKVGEFQTEFDAPAITDGTLLFDLAKGVTADVTWKVAAKGAVTQPGGNLRMEFAAETDFRASLRQKPKATEGG